MSDIINPHDKFFKAMFSRTEVARDFLLRNLPPEISALIEPDSIALTKDSYIDHALREQFSDLLYTAKYESNRDLYLYLLFEHKSYPEPHIAFHLLRYMIQIWEKDLKNNSSLPLYPIVPLVFYHGKEEWKIATDFKSISADEPIFRPYFPDFQYLLYDTHRYDEYEISGEWLLRISIFMMKYIFRPEFPSKLKEIFQLLQEKENEPGIRDILEIMVRYITSTNDRIPYDDLVVEIENRFHETGANIMPTIAEQFIEKGLQTGRQEKSREDILDILETRFSYVSPEIKSRLDQIEDPDLLKQLLKSAVTVNSCDDFFQIVVAI